MCIYFFFFNDTATTEIYTLSLHDALPISGIQRGTGSKGTGNTGFGFGLGFGHHDGIHGDRKSTRLNSSHGYISYAVFCLKKKKSNVALRSLPLDNSPVDDPSPSIALSAAH